MRSQSHKISHLVNDFLRGRIPLSVNQFVHVGAVYIAILGKRIDTDIFCGNIIIKQI